LPRSFGRIDGQFAVLLQVDADVRKVLQRGAVESSVGTLPSTVRKAFCAPRSVLSPFSTAATLVVAL
jgi:hypothetical protein